MNPWVFVALTAVLSGAAATVGEILVRRTMEKKGDEEVITEEELLMIKQHREKKANE